MMDLVAIARETGLRQHLHGINAATARELLQQFVDAVANRNPAPAVRIYDYVWPQRPEHECTYSCSYTPAQHLAKGELLAVVHPSQINGYLQREGDPAPKTAT